MPTEAIHLSALADCIVGSTVKSFLSQSGHIQDARVGATLIDLPYYENFSLTVLRYLAKKPVVNSAWGDLLHQEQPVAVAKALIKAAARLRHSDATRHEGERLLALGLGFVSHMAVDAAIHPLVNRLASERATHLNDSALRQHSEVEKFQSVLFHEERLGFDFMGRAAFSKYIQVEFLSLLSSQTVSLALLQAVKTALGRAPSLQEFEGWRQGQRHYALLLSSPLGKLLASESAKDEERTAVYEGPKVNFAQCFQSAVRYSRSCMEAAMCLAEDADSEAAFLAIAPRGSIDHPQELPLIYRA